jgi:putative transposase
MTNHVHLLVMPRDEDSLPRMMQSLGRRYVRHVNFVYRRSGTFWEGRYRAAPIDSRARDRLIAAASACDDSAPLYRPAVTRPSDDEDRNVS